MKNILIGITFAMFWASASVATKIGLQYSPPLAIANTRFFIAGTILIAIYCIKTQKNRQWPKRTELTKIAYFALFNSTLYAFFYVTAMKYTDAGIGSLSVSINPLMIVILSSLMLGRSSNWVEWLCIFLGIAGIFIASYPLLQNSTTTFLGLTLIFASMLIVSYASVYFAKIKLKMDNILFNGVQLWCGALLLLPLTLSLGHYQQMVLDVKLIASILWLSIAVSIIGLSCWFYLLKKDAVHASLWLFLCPLFGFFYAWLFMDEPITSYTIAGTILVIAALSISQKGKLQNRKLKAEKVES